MTSLSEVKAEEWEELRRVADAPRGEYDQGLSLRAIKRVIGRWWLYKEWFGLEGEVSRTSLKPNQLAARQKGAGELDRYRQE